MYELPAFEIATQNLQLQNKFWPKLQLLWNIIR